MSNGKNIKTEFLILRVEAEFKAALVKAAKAAGQTVSEFVRKVLTKKV